MAGPARTPREVNIDFLQKTLEKNPNITWEKLRLYFITKWTEKTLATYLYILRQRGLNVPNVPDHIRAKTAKF